jgi:glycerol-3-phosphate acyltransferase PlsX
MLDLGANTKATPQQLLQFAAMGSIIARDVYGLASPRIGLLNIGTEDMKGHEVVQAAHALIGAAPLNYVGFVEGDDIFSGDVDVVVTEGFTGNVAWKTMEASPASSPIACARNSALLSESARRPDRAPGSAPCGRGPRPASLRRACMSRPRRDRGKSRSRADGVAFARAIGTAQSSRRAAA